MTYTVDFKTEKDWFWKKLKKVKGDGIMPDSPVPTRFFILDDESRIEIPILGTIFKFSYERFLMIKQNMEREANQDIKTN
jgi:hypothetical protein